MSTALHPLNIPPDRWRPNPADRYGPTSASSVQSEPAVSFCTSEQMDLLRQVFEEFDRASRRPHLITLTHERHH